MFWKINKIYRFKADCPFNFNLIKKGTRTKLLSIEHKDDLYGNIHGTFDIHGYGLVLYSLNGQFCALLEEVNECD